LKHEGRQRNKMESNAHLTPQQDTRKTNCRFQTDYTLSATLSMRNRIEIVRTYTSGSEDHPGFLIFHDIRWKNRNEKVVLDFRYALFDTDTYNERIYAYERDILYAFSVPAYYYKGAKGIFLARIKFNAAISGWFRVSRIWYSNKQKIGTGPEEIDGNAVTEVKLQLQVKIR